VRTQKKINKKQRREGYYNEKTENVKKIVAVGFEPTRTSSVQNILSLPP